MKQDLELRAWQARFRHYIELVRGWTKRTREAYCGELKPFFAYLERQGITHLGRLTRPHLEGYRLELSQLRVENKPLTARTQQARLSAIKQFVRFLYRENFLLLDLAANFEIPAIVKGLPRTVLSEPEVVRLLEAPDTTTIEGLRDRAALELFYGTGLRNTELRELSLRHLDLANGVVRIERGKGNKARVLPLGEEAQAWLEEYLEKARPQLVRSPEQDRVFLTNWGCELTRRWLSFRTRKVAEKAGITKPATPHVLRHSCATHMLRRGAGVRHLQALLGHVCLNTTQLYTRVEVSDLAKVVRQFHPREAL
jgi:integrase/recombinase XerD